MRAMFAIVLLASNPLGAEVLRMRQVDSTSVHIANQQGAINTSEDIAIALDLRAKGRVEIVSKGTREEHNLYVMNGANYNTVDRVTWATTWRGTWKLEKSALALELTLDKDACSAVRDEDGRKTPKACETASTHAVLACEAATIEVGEKKTRVGAWRCSPADGTELGESPSSWVFPKDGKTAKQRCVEVRAGRMMATSYAPCP